MPLIPEASHEAGIASSILSFYIDIYKNRLSFFEDIFKFLTSVVMFFVKHCLAVALCYFTPNKCKLKFLKIKNLNLEKTLKVFFR